MRWEWKWDERYLTRTRRGERKRRGKEQTHTNTPSPERANPERARGKEKSGGSTDTDQDQRGGGRRKRLNQPAKAKTNKDLSTRRSQPTWGGRRAWDRGPMGISWWNHEKLNQDSVPKFLNVVRLFPAPGPCSSQPQGHKTASKFQRIRCTICLTSPDNQKEKRPHLKDVCLPFHNDLTWCRVATKVAAKNGGFRLFRAVPLERAQITGIPGTSGAAGDHKMADKPQGQLLQCT